MASGITIYGNKETLINITRTHQALGHGCLVTVWKVLFQGQDDAVSNDGSQDQVLKWSENHRSRKTLTDCNLQAAQADIPENI